MADPEQRERESQETPDTKFHERRDEEETERDRLAERASEELTEADGGEDRD